MRRKKIKKRMKTLIFSCFFLIGALVAVYFLHEDNKPKPNKDGSIVVKVVDQGVTQQQIDAVERLKKNH